MEKILSSKAPQMDTLEQFIQKQKPMFGKSLIMGNMKIKCSKRTFYFLFCPKWFALRPILDSACFAIKPDQFPFFQDHGRTFH